MSTPDGGVIEDEEKILRCVHDYCRTLYSKDSQVEQHIPLRDEVLLLLDMIFFEEDNR